MRNSVTIVATVLVFGTALAVAEHRRHSQGTFKREAPPQVIPSSFDADKAGQGDVVRAAGRIEGRTEAVEMRARIIEQIAEIHVIEGEWVSKGDVLMSLDASRLEGERDLAAAMLLEAEAKKERLINGYRETEIETARQEYEATRARLAAADKAFERALKLAKSNAVSQLTLDNRHADVNSWRATSAAAKKRLETLELPPRQDDLMAATAAVQAAKSRLTIAEINLSRCNIRAPSEGRVLAIEAEIGELTGPEAPEALIIMSDTSQLRTVAEIDEYDALKMRPGQCCQITADGAPGILATGTVVEIEPRMNPKEVFGQWAGERSDTHSRRVWIELDETAHDLPIGFPVDVYIDALKTD